MERGRGSKRQREIADEVMERRTDGRTDGGIFIVIRGKTKKSAPTMKGETDLSSFLL